MAQVINTNTLSLMTQNNMNKSQSALSTAIERLSSGLRINSAKDDAAGQAIANRFTSNINGLTQASRNANDGISVAQTTEGSLSEINNNLQRIRELSVQAANGTNSASDLSSIQDEISSRLSEIDRVSGQTQFNGVNVLASDQTMKIQVGANDGQTISIDLQKIDSTTLGLNGFNVNGTGTTTNKAATVSNLTAAGAVVAGTGYKVTTNNTAITAAQAIDKMADGDTVAVGAPTTTTYTYDAKAGNFTSTANVLTAGVGSFVADQKLLPSTGQTKTGVYTTTADPTKSVNFTVDSTGNLTIGGQKAYLANGNLSTNDSSGAGTQATLQSLFTGADAAATASTISLGGTDYNIKTGAAAGLSYTATTSKDVVISQLDATTAASTITLGTGVYNHAVTFAAGSLDSNNTYLDSDNEMSGTASYDTNYAVNADTGAVTVTGGTGTGKYEAVAGAAVYVNTAGKLTTDTTSTGTATADPLAALDAAISKVDKFRSSLGAVQNRFDSAITNLSNTTTNLSSAQSRIQDADYATEVSAMSKAQILQQAGTSVLAKANQVPQSVLSLLQ
ncbi:flagellin FliC [Rahnella variigena]|uniref:FliC/FljB family flagellin n=1 Tax=Rahnella variigena TaxID=574964 RepID=UPI00101C048B|nr:FliC/FljB family flagellin [Rahnella variigena]RYJ12365.1 flagellin FliC [Rahnella variigena]